MFFSLNKKKKFKKKKSFLKKLGFTLIELLIVIALIGVFSASLLVWIDPATSIERVETTQTIKQMLAVKNAVSIYVIDTGMLPPECRLDCTESSDPFINSLGISGWNGPYINGGVWNLAHPWGGQIGVAQIDYNNNGKNEVWVVLDDDAPGTNWADNSGQIPENIILRIDQDVDNGDLTGGTMFIGNGTNIFPTGEAAWRVYRIGEE